MCVFYFSFIYFSFIFISWRLITLQYCSGFLPYIDMNQPWIYMCSPSRSPLPHPSPHGRFLFQLLIRYKNKRWKKKDVRKSGPQKTTCFFLTCKFFSLWASLVAQTVKNLPAMQETWVWSLGQEDPLEKEMATHSSSLAWRNLWTEEPGRLQSMVSQRLRHNSSTNTVTTLSHLKC